MHRPLPITAFVLLLVSLPVYAQRGGGGHASGGGHAGGFASGGFASHSFASHSSGARAFSGTRSGYGARSIAPRSYSRQPLYSRNYNRGFNHSGVGVRIRSYGYGYGNRCNGYGCGLGYGYPYLGGGVDPYWWWNSGSYDQDQQDQTGLANDMNQQSLDEQRMREQGDQDAYARSAPPPPHQAERTEASPSTVLVFRDQHKQEVQNYAIVGQTVWIFGQRTEKIPLSDLDLPATTKANDDRGIDFRVPGGNEGQ
jgi:hypothetical protein